MSGGGKSSLECLDGEDVNEHTMDVPPAETANALRRAPKRKQNGAFTRAEKIAYQTDRPVHLEILSTATEYGMQGLGGTNVVDSRNLRNDVRKALVFFGHGIAGGMVECDAFMGMINKQRDALKLADHKSFMYESQAAASPGVVPRKKTHHSRPPLNGYAHSSKPVGVGIAAAAAWTAAKSTKKASANPADTSTKKASANPADTSTKKAKANPADTSTKKAKATAKPAAKAQAADKASAKPAAKPAADPEPEPEPEHEATASAPGVAANDGPVVPPQGGEARTPRSAAIGGGIPVPPYLLEKYLLEKQEQKEKHVQRRHGLVERNAVLEKQLALVQVERDTLVQKCESQTKFLDLQHTENVDLRQQNEELTVQLEDCDPDQRNLCLLRVRQLTQICKRATRHMSKEQLREFKENECNQFSDSSDDPASEGGSSSERQSAEGVAEKDASELDLWGDEVPETPPDSV